ncbi:amidohydrolase family protein [Puia sp.]|jgi:imidazolonepropionase-like amidohydrolase|uniref:amidohydrolase family protein n=1 Tax=Puia sp. TaxID=2045100 RepID=UPI002F404D47
MRRYLLLCLLPVTAFAQHFTADVQKYIDYPGGTIAITDVTVIDGTGAAPRGHQTIVMEGGRISAVGAAANVRVPAGATMIAGSGKTVIPGLVMLHEHLYYTIPIDGFFNVAEMPGSFPRMYLAGGVTTSRTGGSIEPQTDLALRRMIGEGKMIGPDMDITAPYIERPGFDIPSINMIRDSAQAAREVAHWADKGCTSIKMYMHITRGDMMATVREAHQRGMKVTGHLCTVTYREAAEIGIDDLEHGFMASSDFDEGRVADSFDYPKAHQALQQLPVNSPKMKELIGLLIRKKVAVTSTLPVFEPYTGHEVILGGGGDAVLPVVYDRVKAGWDRAQGHDSLSADLFRREQAWEKQFFDGGGLLVAGTDPTGAGRTIAGYSDWREIELLVEGGFSIPQAIQVCTLNGARYLGRDKEIGTVAAGKRADLVLIDGDLGADVKTIRKMAVVFKGGVGFDTQKILASVKGRVGLN